MGGEYKLSDADEKKIHESLNAIKRQIQRVVLCRKCGEPIKFVLEGNRMAPYDVDDTPHWQTCAYSSFTQKKTSMHIAKKLGIFFIIKHGIDLEKEADFTRKEVQTLHAILERVFKTNTKDSLESDQEGDLKVLAENEALVEGSKVEDEIQFQPSPCDPVGDPDEERAAVQEAIDKGL